MNRIEIIKQLKEEKSFIKNEFLTPENIHDYLYIIREPLKGSVSNFENSYNIVSGKYKNNFMFSYKDSLKDYLLIGKSSTSSNPQQIFVGSEVERQIYLIGEDFPMSHGILTVIIIPDSSYFEQKTKGSIPKFEKSVLKSNINNSDISVDQLLCIEYARAASNRIGLTLKRAIDYRKSK